MEKSKKQKSGMFSTKILKCQLDMHIMISQKKKSIEAFKLGRVFCVTEIPRTWE
jgi:hypothetical protein